MFAFHTHARMHAHTHTHTHTPTVVKEAMQTLLALASTVQNCVPIFVVSPAPKHTLKHLVLPCLSPDITFSGAEFILHAGAGLPIYGVGGGVCGRASEHPCVKS